MGGWVGGWVGFVFWGGGGGKGRTDGLFLNEGDCTASETSSRHPTAQNAGGFHGLCDEEIEFFAGDLFLGGGGLSGWVDMYVYAIGGWVGGWVKSFFFTS